MLVYIELEDSLRSVSDYCFGGLTTRQKVLGSKPNVSRHLKLPNSNVHCGVM